MKSGIYFILNQMTNKFYIGSSYNIKKRWKAHMRLLNKNNHHSIHLQHSWNKYGFQSFSFGILEECSVKNLLDREQFYLDEMKPEYNICLVAGSSLGVKRSEKTKNKMKGKKHSQESKNIMSKKKIGHQVSQTTRNKISESLKGKMGGEKNPMFGRKGIKSPKYGKKCSAETKQKISETKKGERHPFFGKNGEDSGHVILTTQQVLEIREKYASGKYTQKELGKKYGVDETNISRIICRKTWKHI